MQIDESSSYWSDVGYEHKSVSGPVIYMCIQQVIPHMKLSTYSQYLWLAQWSVVSHVRVPKFQSTLSIAATLCCSYTQLQLHSVATLYVEVTVYCSQFNELRAFSVQSACRFITLKSETSDREYISTAHYNHTHPPLCCLVQVFSDVVINHVEVNFSI